MAIIGDIRKRSGLLVGAIALAIFLFLLGDAVNNQFGVFRRGKGNEAGSVNGELITYQDYSNQVSENVKNLESQYKTSINDQQRNQINMSTWNDMVSKILMDNVCSSTGMTVSDDEMVYLTTSDNPHPMIHQAFGGAQYNPMYVKQFLQNIDIDDKGQEPGYKRKAWNQLVKEIRKSQLQTKFSNLIVKGVGFVPDWMAEEKYYESNNVADIKYIMLPYAEVNDNDVKYTDNDLKDYLSSHSAAFSLPDESRNIRYLAFDIAASSVDSMATLKWLGEKLDEFRNSKTKSDDSLFVKLYSETSFDDLYKTRDQLLGSAMADSFFSLPVGAVVGPYVEGGMYKYAKVSAHKMLSDSVHVKEVLFSFANVRSEAEQKARFALIDSLYKAIDSFHTDISAVALAYSDDQNAKALGGDIGWVKFNDPTKDEGYKGLVFHNGQPGKVYRYIDAQNNVIRFIEVVEERPSKPGVKVAYFTRSILPSQETENNIYQNATQFVTSNSTEEKFKAYMKAHELEVRAGANITRESYDVMGLGSARPLVKWVFSAKRGDVSPVISIGTSNDRRHVIAYLESVRGTGTPDLESVREEVKLRFLQEKKFDILAKKIADTKASNIEDLAAKLGKQAIEADKISFLNTNLPTGNEPAIAATGVALAANKLSGPVKGERGAYAVQKINGIVAPKPGDLSQQKMMMARESYMKARQAEEALKRLAKIEDNRLLFEGGGN